ncbi:gamma-glutamyltransferase family protein [Cryobacterium sp. TMT1-2-2]|uniref:gamma-glutamyltransferase family protein n=1 Tax=Cryobacterium sp. TMT1-2-2 TaxID=1259233 RepID=UPI001F54623C|nr:gamma-glutamyltransferase [Cryobacterium sp. TMT1-2-2]
MTMISTPTSESSVTARSGAIATSHSLATAAGEAAYAAGGNAIDAALAAAAALAVVYPHNTALGGDLVALVRTPEGRVHCVNATGVAAQNVDITELRKRHGGQLPQRGVDTITVPGTISGWKEISRLGAELPWAEQFNLSIQYAAEGVPVSHSLAEALINGRDLIARDPGINSIFLSDGQPLGEGALLQQPALARTLSTLAKGGPDEFYRGEIGRTLVDGLSRLGSALTFDDFADYQAEVCEPISLEYRGHRVHTSPPNTQGFILLRVLKMLDELGIQDPLGRDADSLGRLFFDGNRFREELLADPRFTALDLDQLLQGASLGGEGTGNIQIPTGDTVGIAAADSDGLAVSLIQSIYFSFGSGILEPTTGILMQNRGMSFSLDADSPNILAPGKRPSHTLMPVLVTQGEHLRWANATMGGKGQPQIHTQAILRLLAGATPEDTVSSARWIVGPHVPTDGPETVYVETDTAPEAKEAILKTGFAVHEIPPLTDWMGHLQIVAAQPDGIFTAASDPRSDGSAFVVPRA